MRFSLLFIINSGCSWIHKQSFWFWCIYICNWIIWSFKLILENFKNWKAESGKENSLIFKTLIFTTSNIETLNMHVLSFFMRNIDFADYHYLHCFRESDFQSLYVERVLRLIFSLLRYYIKNSVISKKSKSWTFRKHNLK